MGLRTAVSLSLAGVASAGEYKCPGSGSLIRAWMETTATTMRGTSCADVKTEIIARVNAKKGWMDPHNAGIYTLLATDSDNVIKTQRTANASTSVGGRVYTDKQVFELTDIDSEYPLAGYCEIKACSESQGFSVGDLSTNYCDIRNLYCSFADGCSTVTKEFDTKEVEYKKSVGAEHDFSKCIAKPASSATTLDAYTCPGSRSFIHASMKVTATASATCANVKAEIKARASAESGWKDPHNNGVYSVLDSDSNNTIHTQRTTNPATSVGGQIYTDRQTFVLIDVGTSCQIKACSESQGTSVGDFSTNYCDLRNLYCGSADGCSTVHSDFDAKESSHSGSIGAGYDSSKCIVQQVVSV